MRRCLTEVDSCFQLLLPFDFGPGLPAAPPAKDVAALEEGTRDLGPEDEAQPCCSKTLCARARPPAAAVTGDPAQGAEDEDSDQEAFVRQHGLGSHKYTLDVELSAGNRPPAGAQAVPAPGLLGRGPPGHVCEAGRDPRGRARGDLPAVWLGRGAAGASILAAVGAARGAAAGSRTARPVPEKPRACRASCGGAQGSGRGSLPGS